MSVSEEEVAGTSRSALSPLTAGDLLPSGQEAKQEQADEAA
jgi:hypothetical protein